MVSPAASERFQDAPWLADLDPASRLAVLNVLVEGRADAGAALVEQGLPNDRITFLLDGRVTVDRLDEDGRSEPVATLAAPTVFGESSFFRGLPPTVSVRASSPAWFLTLDRQAHALLRRADPKAAEQLAVAALRVLADRFDQLDRRVSAYITSKPAGHTRATEWAGFRARLFEEANL